MLSKLFSVLCLIALVFSVNMRIYDKAGDYVLNPEDYNYQNNIIIELFSAGSGSSFALSNSGLSDNNTFCAGVSGNYVKMNISTLGNSVFNFTLGPGGICTLNSYTSSDGVNGGISSFYNAANPTKLNITLIGGYSTKLVQTHPDKIIPNTYIYGSNDKSLFHENGLYYKCVTEDMLSYAQYGPPSYNGAYGGTTYNSKDPRSYPSECSGYMGSGAGFGCNVLQQNKMGYAGYYSGGDGALILYY